MAQKGNILIKNLILLTGILSMFVVVEKKSKSAIFSQKHIHYIKGAGEISLMIRHKRMLLVTRKSEYTKAAKLS